ncbi:NAD(P)/FAD-dependent oxidoreductase [Amaricoccus tamworthensis]|uniref:NAD(P)/FAD-dependent oxidoreductase n=1 Tax=Amaricoccus tamworthensis TaxID=57002 RepID=UPI003C7ACA2A
MENLDARISVIGAGQAGASLVAKLRDLGHRGPITLIGDEPSLPYQRPPLSKAYLKGEMQLERLYLRPATFYADQNIEVLTGVRVVSIDRAAKEVVLEDGRRIGHDLLALTTGTTPRRLPGDIGGDLDDVHVMRSLAHADALAEGLARGHGAALIVGGGYIGLEAAAVLREKALKVTVLEAAPRILARVASAETADFFRDLHRNNGVDIREGVMLSRLVGENGRVTGGELSDGTVIPADVALVGIGVVPNDGLARDAGLELDNGIVVDGAGRTSDPSIFAAGDCTNFPYRGVRIRLESVPNAIDQAEAVAAAMLGGDVDYVAKPWFWSDQYNIKLQIAGLNAGYDRTVVRPGVREGTQSVWYYAGDELLAVDAMNDPRSYMMAKRWIEAGVSPDAGQVADPGVELKGLA